MWIFHLPFFLHTWLSQQFSIPFLVFLHSRPSRRCPRDTQRPGRVWTGQGAGPRRGCWAHFLVSSGWWQKFSFSSADWRRWTWLADRLKLEEKRWDVNSWIMRWIRFNRWLHKTGFEVCPHLKIIVFFIVTVDPRILVGLILVFVVTMLPQYPQTPFLLVLQRI